MIKIQFLLICFIVIFYAKLSFGYDTLRVSIAEAEKIFLEKNLLLLSQKYNIEEAKANILTAKIYDNPNFHFEIGAYNPALDQKYFNTSSQGQQLVNVNQLFHLAGQRNKRINLVTINKNIAELQFYDLLRTLRYTLRSNYIDLYYNIEALKFYNEEILIIERTVNLYENQFKKGNLSLKEVVRLKSLLFSLQTEKLQYVNLISQIQQTLNVLLQSNENVVVEPHIDTLARRKFNLETSQLATFLDSGLVKRYDLRIYQSQVDYANADYKYQKALGMPDPTIGITADRASNYIKNYIGPVLDIPLPVFNRNQGNVQAAKIRINENRLQYQYYDKIVQQEIIQSYVSALETDKLFRTFDQKFTSDFDLLIGSVITNFEKRNISMIEFIDLYESYKATTIQKYNLENSRMNSLEDLNYKTGSQFFNW